MLGFFFLPGGDQGRMEGGVKKGKEPKANTGADFRPGVKRFGTRLPIRTSGVNRSPAAPRRLIPLTGGRGCRVWDLDQSEGRVPRRQHHNWLDLT